jgi:hypothetical protein
MLRVEHSADFGSREVLAPVERIEVEPGPNRPVLDAQRSSWEQTAFVVRGAYFQHEFLRPGRASAARA